jgi:hypothetical protein
MKLGLKLLLAALILLGVMALFALVAGWLWYIVIGIAILGAIALAVSWGHGNSKAGPPAARTETRQEKAALRELRTLEKEQEREQKLTRRSR